MTIPPCKFGQTSGVCFRQELEARNAELVTTLVTTLWDIATECLRGSNADLRARNGELAEVLQGIVDRYEANEPLSFFSIGKAKDALAKAKGES